MEIQVKITAHDRSACLQDALAASWLNDSFTDLIISTFGRGDENEEKRESFTRVNKSVLAAASPVLAHLLAGVPPAEETATLVFADYSNNTVMNFLFFIYHGYILQNTDIEDLNCILKEFGIGIDFSVPVVELRESEGPENLQRSDDKVDVSHDLSPQLLNLPDLSSFSHKFESLQNPEFFYGKSVLEKMALRRLPPFRIYADNETDSVLPEIANRNVKELTQQSVGGHDLLQQKQKIVALSEETNQHLKKNVYRNYMQFIETAKEISFLESEMYQLSHLLTDQKTLLVTLLETSVLGDKPPGIHGFKTSKLVAESPENALSKSEEEKRKQLTALLEKVEGCASIVEVPTRLLIHEGDMVELDPSDNSAIQRVRGYLLNDSLMIATWLRNRRGPMRYQYQALYELERLAVVNIRDLGPVKHAFKLMMFPDTRVLQCANAADKKQWLDAIDAAKKAKLEQPSAITTSYEPKDHESHKKEIPLNPFDEEEQSLVSVPQSPTQPESVPDWVNELSDDLEVCIAQRDFEEAVALVEKNRSFWDQANSTLVNLYRDLKTKIDSRVNQLGQVLANELRVSPDKSLQGGPRAARRALMLLTRLGKATLACDLFLKHRSALLKRDLRQLPTEGAAVLYIKRLAGVFFPFLVDTGREVTRAFANVQVCLSAFVVWARHEVHKFCSSFKRHVFTPSPRSYSVVFMVGIIISRITLVTVFKLILCFILENTLASIASKAIQVFGTRSTAAVVVAVLKWHYCCCTITTDSSSSCCYSSSSKVHTEKCKLSADINIVEHIQVVVSLLLIKLYLMEYDLNLIFNKYRRFITRYKGFAVFGCLLSGCYHKLSFVINLLSGSAVAYRHIVSKCNVLLVYTLSAIERIKILLKSVC
nr:EOG090X021B [Eulimnadia texana]